MERTPPPSWCRDICANSMSRGCLEKCAATRIAENFLPETETTIYKAPPFPLEEYLWDMNPEERIAANGYYMALVVAGAQQQDLEEEVGDIDEEELIRSEKLFEDIKNLPDQHGEETGDN